MFIGEKSGKWNMSDASDYAIKHVADSDPKYHLGHTLSELLPFSISFSKHQFLLLFVSFILVSSIVISVRAYISHKKNIPNKFMSIIEMFVIYLRDDVLKNFIGNKEYREWAPLVYTIFFFVLFGICFSNC